MNSSVFSIGSFFTQVRVLALVSVAVLMFFTVPAYTFAQTQAAATAAIDQSSLVRTTQEFKVTGTAVGATTLQVLLIAGEYTGATDWSSASAATKTNRIHNVNATVKVAGGKWSAPFVKVNNSAGVPLGTYTVLVFDISKNMANPDVPPVFLTKSTIRVTGKATINKGSLLQKKKEFTIAGTASGATDLQVLLLPGEYTGSADWNSASAAAKASSLHNVTATAKVEKGTWEAFFVKSGANGGVPFGAYTLMVFDISKNMVDPDATPVLLTRGALVVNGATATVDKNALSQTTNEFRVTGSATDAVLLQALLVPGKYTGKTDWDSVSAVTGPNTIYNVNATSPVESGKWAASFVASNNSKGVPSGVYTVFVFDISNETSATSNSVPVLLTRATITVKNTIPSLRPYCNIAPDKLELKFGQPVTLSWVSRNASMATLQPSEGSIALKGSMKRTVEYTGQELPFTQKWTMTVSGAGGSIDCSAIVKYTLASSTSSNAAFSAQSLMAAAVAGITIPFAAVTNAVSDMLLMLGLY